MSRLCKWFGHKWVWGTHYVSYCDRCGYVPDEEERYNITSRHYNI
jgi:prophage protein DUF1660